MKKDLELMQKCIGLAKRGRKLASPNPLVGALIVKNNEIISSGFHKVFGGAHAEAVALKKAGKKAGKATLFVNLEPCCHFGKQPPCTRKIIEAKVKEVVIATPDPNPLVRGRGIRELKKHGIMVRTGILEKTARELNEKFFKFKQNGRPFVLIKNAVSLDGKISYFGGRKKISGKKSLEKVHELRSEFDAILVGVNTVKKDNPRLTARTKNSKNPLRIVVDSKGRIPAKSRVLNSEAATIVVCTKHAKKSELKKIVECKAGVIISREKNGLVDLKNTVLELGKIGVSSILVEGGQRITASFLKENLFDKVILIVSPKIIGFGKKFLWQKNLWKKLKIEAVNFVGEDAWITFCPRG